MSDTTLPRIGALVPAGNVTFEPDLWRDLGGHATVHSHRVATRRAYPTECAESMIEANVAAVTGAALLARIRPDALAYGFTTASFFEQRAGAMQLRGRLQEEAGCPVVLPSLAILDRLTELSAWRVSVITPYPSWNNEVLHAFLEDAGTKVMNLVGDTRPAPQSPPLWTQTPREIFEHVMRHADRRADAVLLPCTAWRAREAVPYLLAELAVPVITANQATILSLMRAAHLPLPGFLAGPAHRNEASAHGTAAAKAG
ncbi:maleate cis-trans isomerase family protein [Bordetella ansorpii]|uniref:maleate cis-trans isomerase family protein n=1 Tax=Bordetella ansorpii TaxID=288768 RepID=UPI00082BDB98|nr:hypothetical protein [Bordetella ansorpii]